MTESYHCPMCFGTAHATQVVDDPCCCGQYMINSEDWQSNRGEWLKAREHKLSRLPESERRQIQEKAFRNGREV